jgi:hypothetical protein
MLSSKSKASSGAWGRGVRALLHGGRGCIERGTAVATTRVAKDAQKGITIITRVLPVRPVPNKFHQKWE